MKTDGTRTRALSQLDAFFVAYQERAGILMQLGFEVELRGNVRRELLEETMARLVARWPHLGQTLRRRLNGLAWAGEPRTREMLRTCETREDLARFRNQPLDPFREPPFQLLHLRGEDVCTIAALAHHAVADGESFIEICHEVVRTLARLAAGEELPSPAPEACVALGEVVSPARLLRRGQLGDAWRYTRRLAREAKASRSARLAVRSCAPGDTAMRERKLGAEGLRALRRRAARERVSPAWLCAAGWARAVAAWNLERGRVEDRPVSLEVPVSLRPRGGGDAGRYAGNFITPLVVFADPRRPLAEVARTLREQLKSGLRRGAHLGVPALTAPARHLPWPLFRRLAINTTSTGFATSHFTWLELPARFDAEVAELSRGALRLLDFRAYTPVCLHMGAALLATVAGDDARLSLTYRETAFDEREADTLLDLLTDELGLRAGDPAVNVEAAATAAR